MTQKSGARKRSNPWRMCFSGDSGERDEREAPRTPPTAVRSAGGDVTTPAQQQQNNSVIVEEVCEKVVTTTEQQLSSVPNSNKNNLNNDKEVEESNKHNESFIMPNSGKCSVSREFAKQLWIQGVKPVMHFKCRSHKYPCAENIRRIDVSEDKVSWSVPFSEYKPTDYTSPSVLAKPVWADVDIRVETGFSMPKWNQVDGNVDRVSFTGQYDIDPHSNVPRNPVGRTGLMGRGSLGRWGPNHAADPIVTRWKRNQSNAIMKDRISGDNILQFIGIQRKDSGEWAIPGGMVDPGEMVSVTLRREFSEEAMNLLEASPEEKLETEQKVQELFQHGHEVYRGYVDDPRNTDNSWMETLAVNFHDDTGLSAGRFNLHAGDDAVGVKWIDINQHLKLFASHINFIEMVAKLHKAHW